MNRYVFLIVLSFLLGACKSMKILEFNSERVKYYKEEFVLGDSLGFAKVDPPYMKVLSFFTSFEDTVQIYVNKKLIGERAIYQINNPNESSDYSGIDQLVDARKGNKKVTLKLMRKKVQVSFDLDARYPLYTIHRSGDTWYVNARYKMLILR